MPLERIEVLGILALALALFVSEKLRVDLVSLIVLSLLMVLGIIAPRDAVQGFSNEATVTIGAMFVLSGALKKVGGLDALTLLFVRAAEKGRRVLVATIVAVVSTVSAFINNTACVAVFLPITLTVARRSRISPSKLLIPMSYAAQFGGVVTLIGTSTNIAVASLAVKSGIAPLQLFEFAPLGLTLVVAGILYMTSIGWKLLPDRGSGDLATEYALGDYLTELVVTPGSRLAGKRLEDSGLSRADLNVLEIMREGAKIWAPMRGERIAAGDVLLVRSSPERILHAKEAFGLEIRPEVKFSDHRLKGGDTVLAELLVAPGSHLQGLRIGESDFRARYHVIVLAIHRRAEIIRERLRDVALTTGDVLLVLGQKDDVSALGALDDFILLRKTERRRADVRKMAIVLGTITGVMAAAAAFHVPVVMAAVVGAVTLVLTRCLNLEEAYEAIDWQVIFLLAGMLPLGDAMRETGTAQWLAQGAVGLVGGLGPTWVLGATYFTVTVMAAIVGHNASAVIMVPIAISTAVSLGVDPRPFVFVVAYAASSEFSTPIGYQTNMMIYGPGGYRFFDYLRVGIPLILLFMTITTLMAPLIWPF